MGFTRAQLQGFRDHEVPDLIGPGLVLLFVGINPGLWTAATRLTSPAPATASIPPCCAPASSSGASTLPPG